MVTTITASLLTHAGAEGGARTRRERALVGHDRPRS